MLLAVFYVFKIATKLRTVELEMYNRHIYTYMEHVRAIGSERIKGHSSHRIFRPTFRRIDHRSISISDDCRFVSSSNVKVSRRFP